VGRLSIDSLRKIRDDVLMLIARCKVNKAFVIRNVKNPDSTSMVSTILCSTRPFPQFV
jgi:hypothetical protein